jgi:hypothetical protein
MQIIYSFNLSMDDYIKNIYFLDFPEFNNCPICNDQVNLIKHGFYYRNAIGSDNFVYQLAIRRLICPHCGKTISLLPDFLMPYFQSTVTRIIDLLSNLLANKLQKYIQLTYFYKFRFIKNLNGIISFFRFHGVLVPLPNKIDEKLFFLINEIKEFSVILFSKLYIFKFNTRFLSK